MVLSRIELTNIDIYDFVRSTYHFFQFIIATKETKEQNGGMQFVGIFSVSDIEISNIYLANYFCCLLFYIQQYLLYFYYNIYSSVYMTDIIANGNNKHMSSYNYLFSFYYNNGAFTLENSIFSNFVFDEYSMPMFFKYAHYYANSSHLYI